MTARCEGRVAQVTPLDNETQGRTAQKPLTGPPPPAFAKYKVRTGRSDGTCGFGACISREWLAHQHTRVTVHGLPVEENIANVRVELLVFSHLLIGHEVD